MSQDPDQKRYRKLYREEFDLASAALKGRDGSLEWSEVDYIAFVWSGPTVCIVFYPHKTSAGNYHIRVRDQGSKDKALAVKIMDELDSAAGYNCTFTRKLNLGK